MGPACVPDGCLDRFPLFLQLDLLHHHSTQARCRKETKWRLVKTDRQRSIINSQGTDTQRHTETEQAKWCRQTPSFLTSTILPCVYYLISQDTFAKHNSNPFLTHFYIFTSYSTFRVFYTCFVESCLLIALYYGLQLSIYSY